MTKRMKDGSAGWKQLRCEEVTDADGHVTGDALCTHVAPWSHSDRPVYTGERSLSRPLAGHVHISSSPTRHHRHLSDLAQPLKYPAAAMRPSNAKPRPPFHPQCHPHIVDMILSLSSYKTMLKTRLVCSGMRDVVDRYLIEDTLTIQTGRGGRLLFRSPRGILPFFHSHGGSAIQRTAMRRAHHVTITQTVPRSERLNKLLLMLPAACHVQIIHGQSRNQGYRLPEIACLTIVLGDAVCQCSLHSSGEWGHAARKVIIECSAEWHRQCHLVRTVFNSRVEHLELREFTFSWSSVINSPLDRACWLLWSKHRHPAAEGAHFHENHRCAELVIVIAIRKGSGYDGATEYLVSNFSGHFQIERSQVRVHGAGF